jgi:ribonucleoside-diphosphate reductase alpha chain
MKLTGVSEKVFLDRYAMKDRAGGLAENTPQEMWKRVAKAVAAKEKTVVFKKKYEKEFNEMMKKIQPTMNLMKMRMMTCEW